MVFPPLRTKEISTKDLLSWTFDEERFDPDKPVYVDAANPSRSISSRQARSIIRKLIAGFRAAGVKKGDCVCIHSFNDIYYSMIFLAIIGAGGVFAGTNPAYTQFELVHHIKTSHASFMLCEPELLEPIVAATKECGIPKEKILIFNVQGQDVPDGYKSWETLMQHGEDDWVRFDDLKTASTTTAARLYSSGTTGLPKAAMLSHHNFVAQHELVHEFAEKSFEVKRLICLPSFHAAMVPVTHTTPLRAGHTTYVMRRFELEPFLANLEKYKIPELSLVPPLVIATIMSPLNKKYSLKTVVAGGCGAAPLGKGPQARMKALLSPKAKFTQVWGMTETSCICSCFHWPEDDDTGSVGRMLPNVTAKIIDDDGKDISAYDTSGELCVSGPIVFQGYFGNPTANAESFDSDGFFKTGDIAYCDSKTKKWYIIDRKKELIKVRGFQVAPPEIEAVLLSHPQIVDCAVIGVTLEKDASELPRALVVRRPGTGEKLSVDDVKRWVGGKLAKYKQLDGGVRFVDAIPRNASGKILKRILRDDAKKELEHIAKL